MDEKSLCFLNLHPYKQMDGEWLGSQETIMSISLFILFYTSKTTHHMISLDYILSVAML